MQIGLTVQNLCLDKHTNAKSHNLSERHFEQEIIQEFELKKGYFFSNRFFQIYFIDLTRSLRGLFYSYFGSGDQNLNRPVLNTCSKQRQKPDK